MSDSLRPHGLQPTRLLRPWNFPGKTTGVGRHHFLYRINYEVVILIVLTLQMQTFEHLRKLEPIIQNEVRKKNTNIYKQTHICGI